MEAFALPQLQQQGLVLGARRLHGPEHQHAGAIAHGHFDLGHLFADAQPIDGCADGLQTLADRWVQHFAAREIGQKGIAALAKTDQGPPLLDDMPHPETGLAAITPVPGGERWEPALGTDLANAAEDVLQARLFDADLRLGILMLQAATAADGEMGALGLDPFGRGAQHRLDHGLVESPLHAGVAKAHALARQGAIHEDGLAVDMGQAAAFMGQGFDLGLDGRLGNAFRFFRHGSDGGFWLRMRSTVSDSFRCFHDLLSRDAVHWRDPWFSPGRRRCTG